MIWFKDYKIDYLQGLRSANMGEHIGFEFLEIGDDFLTGRIPVDHRTMQPFGILHGGASCVLAESLGSVAAWMTVDPDKFRAVGLEINVNHIRAVTQGHVVGTCAPLHVGRRTQVWQIDMHEEATGKRTAISRLTVAVIEQGTLSTQKENIKIG
ncbi:MAG: thioesterase [Alphaproteobacteria bacterium]|nr:MAG: thioesterase [Alphaproteobacteria bacterium]